MLKHHQTFSIFTFGCRVNQAEGEEISRQLMKKGLKQSEKNPDLFIINSCAVTQKAEREVRQFIYYLHHHLPSTKIILTGCAATFWQKNPPKNKLPVDLVVVNRQKKLLANLIIDHFSLVPKNSSSISFSDKYLASGRAIIKIQDGCHLFCRYCIVPYLRGQPQSTPISEIVQQIIFLPPTVKEVILTAVNTQAYGFGTSETLTGLIETIFEKTSISRLSFGSIHPLSIDQKFLDLYRKFFPGGRWVNFFHIPIQSGSEKILQLMNRGYCLSDISEKLFQIKKINPQALIATDIIVGYLNETDKDFAETVNFLEKTPIAKLHLFRFSKRKNTAAYYQAKKIKEPPEQTKKIRAAILKKISEKKYHQFLENQIGRVSPVLFLNQKKDGFQQGLLDNQLPVWVKTSKDIVGQIKQVKVEKNLKEKLFGRLV